MEKLYNSRNEYFKKLFKLKNQSIIKVIYGLQKCGKSTILKNYKQFLLKNDIEKNNILFLDFADLKNQKLLDYKKLYEHISSFAKGKEIAYILLDNIEQVDSYEKVLESLIIKDNIDLYITIKNLNNLNENALLAGSYFAIEILPLSFQEYHIENQRNETEDFNNYLIKGGLPVLVNIDDKSIIKQYLNDLYRSVLVDEILIHKKISDTALLNNLTHFLIDNICELLSYKSISDKLNALNIKTNHLTIKSYVETLIDCKLIYKVDRYDIKNDTLLKSLNKFYFCDVGFINNLFTKKKNNIKGLLENLVFLKLLKDEYQVYIGKINNEEITFIAFKDDKRNYFQVKPSVMSETDYNNAISPLKKINDNYPKYIISMDKIDLSSEGINQLNIVDFLLNF